MDNTFLLFGFPYFNVKSILPKMGGIGRPTLKVFAKNLDVKNIVIMNHFLITFQNCRNVRLKDNGVIVCEIYWWV
jgi:hypothetical protein